MEAAETVFQPLSFRPIYTAPAQINVLCASLSLHPRRTMLALSDNSLVLLTAAGLQRLDWFTDPRLLIVALAQTQDQVAILTLKGFCFVLDGVVFSGTNFTEKWSRFIAAEFLSALEVTTAASDEDFLDAFGLCSSVRPGKASRPGKNSVNALCLELRSESVFSSLDWWGECLIAGALLGDLYFVDSRTGAKECLVQIPAEVHSLTVARDGGTYLLIESAAKEYYWLVLQAACDSESSPFSVISGADSDHFQPYSLARFSGKSVSVQQSGGVDILCVSTSAVVEIYNCSNLKCPIGLYETPGEGFDWVSLFACYIICGLNVGTETRLMVFLKPHSGAQRKVHAETKSAHSMSPQQPRKLCLCQTCDQKQLLPGFSYAKWLGLEGGVSPAMTSSFPLGSVSATQRILWKAPILVTSKLVLETDKVAIDMQKTLMNLVASAGYVRDI